MIWIGKSHWCQQNSLLTLEIQEESKIENEDSDKRKTPPPPPPLSSPPLPPPLTPTRTG
jgi:hypothetical protein